MYTYNPETGVIRCASCIPTGEPPTVLRPPEETAQRSSKSHPSDKRRART